MPVDRRPHVLFVEDEDTVREHLARALSDEFTVETAAGGAAALNAILRTRPDVLVTDLVMPGMDSVELLRTLRATPSTSTIPVLMISGRAPEALRIEARARVRNVLADS